MKKQKLTTEKILIALQGFNEFGSVSMPGNVGMNVMLIAEELEPVSKAFDKLKMSLFDELGLKVKTTNAEGVETESFVPSKVDGVIQPGTKQIAPENAEAYSVRIKELLAVEVELETPEISIGDIRKLTVPPNTLRMIRPFIFFPPAD